MGESTYPLNIDINKPRYDQDNYSGRAKHFLATTNPLNIFASNKSLERARSIVNAYKCKNPLPEGMTTDDLWRAKTLYDSAFHPDTGEKMPLIGRMSAQVPMNMLITGGMMCFYRSTPAVIFWQWLNQSFNAVVNYTNRGGNAKISDKQLIYSYALATTGAVTTALSLNRIFKKAPSLVLRFVPFVAVAAANCVNIPLMRAQELKDGTPVFDQNNNQLGYSKNAAQEGICQVIFSRVMMAAPGMALTPFIMNHLERRGTLCRYPWLNLPMQIALLGLFLTFATPLCCALFKQKAEIPVNRLEEPLRCKVKKMLGVDCPKYVYYNKGL
ncbi:sideroflexin-1 [Onthophagus taurus]|uniref:sideroflexin-1 n=1 Tax=Onthophagus taurus TaxID=166361 RepID=UPI000C20D87A|nr:sideroflexin-1 [Onthophagus taurus]XP_022903381.1 sideroflexin-1 [Onthophagus taurus]